MVAIWLPKDIEDRLAALATATGRTKSSLARQAIVQNLDDLEDLYLAQQRLIEIQAGRVHSIPLEAVLNDFGIRD